MNDREISNIIKESVVSPSNNFTDELIKKVYIEKSTIKKTRLAVVLLCLACLICFLLLVMITLPEFTLFGYAINVSPLFIQIPGIFFILYEIVQIYEIHKNSLISGKNEVVQYG